MDEYYLAFTAINVVLVAILVLVTFYYAWTTRQMLTENKLQRFQDAELRTMIIIKGIVITDKPHEIRVVAVGDYCVQDWKFTVDLIDNDGSIVKSLPTKGFTIGGWESISLEDEDPLENIHYWTIDLLNLFLPNPQDYIKEKSFQLHITAEFTSFFGRNWKFEYKSLALLMDDKMNIFPVGRLIPLFNLIKVKAPWD